MKQELPMSFVVDISYKDSRGSAYREKSPIDMDVARGSLQTVVYGTHDVAKRLKDLVDILKRSAVARGPVEVVSENRSDYRDRKAEERDEAMRQHEEMKRQVLRDSDRDPSDDDSETEGPPSSSGAE